MPSLYANLLGGLDGTADAPKQATISAAPVKYDFKAKAEEVAQEEKKASDGTSAMPRPGVPHPVDRLAHIYLALLPI